MTNQMSDLMSNVLGIALLALGALPIFALTLAQAPTTF